MRFFMRFLYAFTLVCLCIGNVRAQVSSAESMNIVADNTDESADFLSALNNLNVKTIVFSKLAPSSPNAVYKIGLNNTSTPTIYDANGKVLKFEANCRIESDVPLIIKNCIIDASVEDWIFSENIKLEFFSTTTGIFSVKWLGAKGNNSNDDADAIQRSINACLAQGTFNGPRKVFLPKGQYRTTKPIVLKKIGSQPPNIELYGDGSNWGDGTIIYPQFKNTFAIGIQEGKNCVIRNLQIVGKFIPPTPPSADNNVDPYDWYNMPFDNFDDGSDCRDNRYSPYAGIVIDPFKPTGSPGDYYPGFENEMPACDSTCQGGSPCSSGCANGACNVICPGGSTGITIENVTVQGFIVGICSSPNGRLLNAELIKISRVRLANCKLGISGGQAQEKTNVIDNLTVWGGVHTVFATTLYGTEESGHWIITNVNLAGSVIRFIYNKQSNWYPIFISNVFAESLGTFGEMNSGDSQGPNAAQVINSTFNFTRYTYAGFRALAKTDQGVTFRNCSFRYYFHHSISQITNTMMLFVSPRTVFEDCKFSGPPIQELALQNGDRSTIYINCTAGPYSFGQTKFHSTGIIGNDKQFTQAYLNNNNISIVDPHQIENSWLTETYELKGREEFVNFLEPGALTNVRHIPVTGHSAQITVNTDYYYIGGIVCFNNPNTSFELNEYRAHPWGYGIITAISNGQIIVENINIPTGYYRLSCFYPARHLGSFMGDVQNGNTISNLKADFGAELTSYPGNLIKSPYNNSREGWMKVLSYSNNSFTVLGNNGTTLQYNEPGLYFSNGAEKRVETNSRFYPFINSTSANSMIWYKGEVLTQLAKSDHAETFIVCKTGYNILPANETRKAELCPSGEEWRVSGNEIKVINNEPQNIFGTLARPNPNNNPPALSNYDIRIKTNGQNVGVITALPENGNGAGGHFGIGQNFTNANAPTQKLDVDGKIRVRNLPESSPNQRVVFANSEGVLNSLNPSPYGILSYLAGNGTWQILPIFPYIYPAEGLTQEGDKINLGDVCSLGGGQFEINREINMNEHSLFFNTGPKGSIYMGDNRQPNLTCDRLVTRLEISSIGIESASNNSDPDLPSSSGLRFTDLTSMIEPIDNETGGVLSLDANGDVIWVKECCSKFRSNHADNEILNRLTNLEKELKETKEQLKKMKQKNKNTKLTAIAAAILTMITTFGQQTQIIK